MFSGETKCQKENSLVDKFGRRVDYIRLSVTDRCDFRCVYCMTEDRLFYLERKSFLWKNSIR